MRKIFLFIGVLAMFSCKKEKEIVTEQTTQDTIRFSRDSIVKNKDSAVVKSGLELEKFGFPPEITGCSCYFSENKEDFDAQKYIYIDDYGNNAYFKIKKKLVKIPMEEGDFDPSNFQKSIENEEFKMYMNGHKIKEMDEVMMFEGKMTVEIKKTGEKVTTPIYGECGC